MKHLLMDGVQNILYLMIVQMPSDDELAEAAEMEEREHRKG